MFTAACTVSEWLSAGSVSDLASMIGVTSVRSSRTRAGSVLIKCSPIRPRVSSAVHRPQTGRFRARSERCRGGHRDLPAPGRTAERVVVNFGRICYPGRCSPYRLGRHNANGLRRYRRRAVRWRMRQPLAQRTCTRLTATPNRGSAAPTTQLPEVCVSSTTVETAALLSAVRRVD